MNFVVQNFQQHAGVIFHDFECLTCDLFEKKEETYEMEVPLKW